MTEISPSPQSPVSKFLLLDPDAAARTSMAAALKDKGHFVEQAIDGVQALDLLAKTGFDVMIIDLGADQNSGIEIMSRARLSKRDLVIIVLTTRASISSAIAAVRVGAMDYLVKPCRPDDLELVINRALEQRTERLKQENLMNLVSQAMGMLNTTQVSDAPQKEPAPSASVADKVNHGPITLHKQKRQVTVGTKPPRTVDLTEGEWSILLCLLEKPNQVLSYNQLAKLALGYEGMDKWTTESVIRSSVFRLRKKIEGEDAEAPLIKTVRGRGYFFSAV